MLQYQSKTTRFLRLATVCVVSRHTDDNLYLYKGSNKLALPERFFLTLLPLALALASLHYIAHAKQVQTDYL